MVTLVPNYTITFQRQTHDFTFTINFVLCVFSNKLKAKQTQSMKNYLYPLKKNLNSGFL